MPKTVIPMRCSHGLRTRVGGSGPARPAHRLSTVTGSRSKSTDEAVVTLLVVGSRVMVDVVVRGSRVTVEVERPDRDRRVDRDVVEPLDGDVRPDGAVVVDVNGVVGHRYASRSSELDPSVGLTRQLWWKPSLGSAHGVRPSS